MGRYTQMAINERHRRADSATVTRFYSRAFGPRSTTDEGFSMVEMMVALLIIAIVSAASIGFFVQNIRGVNDQRQHQEATYVANQQMETVESLPVTKLVAGRTQAEVNGIYASAAATTMNIAGQDDTANAGNWDASASGANCAASGCVIPVTGPPGASGSPVTVNSVPYSLTTFIDVCWYSNVTGFCTPNSTAITTKEYRVSVWVTWTAPGTCVGGCNYSTSTLIDPSSDPLFNTNISSPSGTLTTPASATVVNDNDASSCTTNGNTYPGTEFIITGGLNLKSNIRVLISTGGGVIPTASIYQPVAAEVDFCLQTYDKPGSYTLSIINTDGGHFQTSITELPNLTGAASWTPGSPNLAISGGGLESGASFTVSGGSFGSVSNLVTGQSINNGNATDDSATLNNFVGPTNGGTATITATNPDLSSATWTVTAPRVTGQTRSAIVSGQTLTTTLTGTGFQSGFTPIVTNATVSSAFVSPTSVTLTLTGMVAGTNATVVLANPDGGKSATVSFAVDPPPVVLTATPNTVVATQTRTVTVNGSGFVTGLSVGQTNGTGLTVMSLSPTQLVLSVTAATVGSDVLTITNPDGGTTSFSLIVDAPPAIAAVTPNPVLVSSTRTLTLTGTGFVSGLTVTAARGTFTLGAVTATSITLTNFTAPTTGPDLLTVTNPDGGVSTFSVNVNPPPTVTSVTGNPVIKGVPETLTVNGTGFETGTPALTVSGSNGTWTISNVTSTSFQMTNFTSNTVGADAMTVNNGDGGTANFTINVDAPPTITSFTPLTAKHNTATTYTVTGTGFVNGATATITEGGTTMTAISAVTWTSSTSVKFTATARATPTSGTSSVVITITNPDGGTASKTSTVTVS
jgi:prepilin-type N-terminal cleavage/methylation domain-containing protein